MGEKECSGCGLFVTRLFVAVSTRVVTNEVKPNRAGKTYQEYELAVRLDVVPLFIGSKKLNRLNAMDVSSWMAELTRKSSPITCGMAP